MIQIIRCASLHDIDRLMEIFSAARRFMRTTGNTNQWVNGYPQRELMEDEIASGHCMVCEDENHVVVATFCFISGPDPTYAYIENGHWLSDSPYYVIHRLASDGSCKGVAKACMEWCMDHGKCLRADTHHDNVVMQHLLESNGFIRCGIIYLDDGSQRIAYQRGL